MEVYALLEWVAYEGCDLLSLHTSAAAAEAAAQAHVARFDRNADELGWYDDADERRCELPGRNSGYLIRRMAVN